MEDWLRRVWERGKSPYVRALGLFVFLLLAELGLISIISDTGFAAEVQQYRGLVWGASVVIALFSAVVWLWLHLVRHGKTAFFRDAQSGTLYLKDLTGKIREIPDDETFTFLGNALGTSGNALEIQTEEVARLRGARLVSIKDWKRPLSPDEQAAKELRRQVHAALEKSLSRFNEDSDPQKMVIRISNRGSEFLHIKNVKFQHRKLPDGALLPSYPKAGPSYTTIPFNEEAAHLAPGDDFEVELKLRQKWIASDIERMKGELGWLILDVIRNGRLVEGILILV